jgi:hypothetical protein
VKFKFLFLASLVFVGCYAIPVSQAQRSEVIGIQNAIKEEIDSLGSMAILNAPYSKADIGEIQKRVDTAKHRLEQWSAKALEVAGS